MGITSIYYILFALAVVLIYYAIPQKIRWMFLLAASIAYMAICGKMILLIYPVASIFVAWICTRQMDKIREEAKSKADRFSVNSR